MPVRTWLPDDEAQRFTVDPEFFDTCAPRHEYAVHNIYVTRTVGVRGFQYAGVPWADYARHWELEGPHA